MNFPAHLRVVVQRLRGVVIENRDALDVMRQHDGTDTVHYVDPPYVHETRSFRQRSKAYRHEMNDQQHRQLAEALASLKGAVVVSGYRCPLYDELFDGWRRIDAAAHADGARDRVESLWLSRGCPQSGLFDKEHA
jgi:DNA adenine methylase